MVYGFIDNGIHCIDSIQPFFLLSCFTPNLNHHLSTFLPYQLISFWRLFFPSIPLSNNSQFLLCLLSIEKVREQSKTFIQSISLCESLFVHLLQCFDKLSFYLLLEVSLLQRSVFIWFCFVIFLSFLSLFLLSPHFLLFFCLKS